MPRGKMNSTQKLEVSYTDMDVLRTLANEGGNAFAVDINDVRKWLFSAESEIAEEVKRNMRSTVLARFGAQAGIKLTTEDAINASNGQAPAKAKK